MKQDKHPEGYYLSIGISFGLILGTLMGLALGNIALGPGIGLAIGAAIGAAWEAEAKKKGKIAPSTKDETKRQKLIVLIALGALILAVLVSLAIILLQK